MRKYPAINFEFFGSIETPQEFMEFESRIINHPKVDSYEIFMRKLAECNWDIGICPLAPIHFNLMKSNTKWVEYTSIGAAVVASIGTVYDDCCGDGCGLLAKTEEEWYTAIESLIKSPQTCFIQVSRAQEKLSKSYSIDSLRNQVLCIFSKAREICHRMHRNFD
jgi:hypothetical protein